MPLSMIPCSSCAVAPSPLVMSCRGGQGFRASVLGFQNFVGGRVECTSYVVGAPVESHFTYVL